MGDIAIRTVALPVTRANEGLEDFGSRALLAAMAAAGERLNFQGRAVEDSGCQTDPATGAAGRPRAVKDEADMLGLSQAGNAGWQLLHGTNGNSFLQA